MFNYIYCEIKADIKYYMHGFFEVFKTFNFTNGPNQNRRKKDKNIELELMGNIKCYHKTVFTVFLFKQR